MMACIKIVFWVVMPTMLDRFPPDFCTFYQTTQCHIPEDSNCQIRILQSFIYLVLQVPSDRLHKLQYLTASDICWHFIRTT
jgi:hypothetical protein